MALDTSDLAGLFKPGQRLFIPGSSGAPSSVLRALERDSSLSAGLDIQCSLVPGINDLNIEALAPDCRVSGLFMQPAWANAQREGRYRALPASYAGFVRELNSRAEFDWLVVQVSPPDERGHCSLGPAVEFVPTVLGRCQRVLALVNPNTPCIPGAPSLPVTRLDLMLEVDDPLPTYSNETDESSLRIARRIAELIDDGSTLQIGLGRVPAALYQTLQTHRRLRLHSGLLSDGYSLLQSTGALDEDHTHTGCVLLGSQSLYRQAAELPGLQLRGCEETHDPAVLRKLERFVAVNSALEVDLFGQCNLEHANGRAISGAGGAPDFARGARLSLHGRSIVALNANINGTARSRIVPQLSPPALASISRVDIDYLVTEHGVANLTGASVLERARAIIAVADPANREQLYEAWQQIAARL